MEYVVLVTEINGMQCVQARMDAHTGQTVPFITLAEARKAASEARAHLKTLHNVFPDVEVVQVGNVDSRLGRVVWQHPKNRWVPAGLNATVDVQII